MIKTISVDVDLDSWTTEELRDEIADRADPGDASLIKVYEYYYTNLKLEAPQVLKDYIYQTLGKNI